MIHFCFGFSSQVKSVLFAIEANLAAVALQGSMAKRFMHHLEPLHTPPQNVPFMRMVRLLDLAFHREYKRLYIIYSLNQLSRSCSNSKEQTHREGLIAPEAIQTYWSKNIK
jgi:hypothetical protein